MNPETVERRLAAIVSADVVGYSRLMASDGPGTVNTLTSYRAQMSSLVAEHGGRVVDSPGDNILMEFPSATGAVGCALKMQRRLEELNADRPAAERMDFRMGVHLGEVLVEGERIYGDGVNIAARLEAMAEPGGVWISRAVRDQLDSKMNITLSDRGERALKNLPDPVHAYSIKLPAKSGHSTVRAETREDKRAAWVAVLPFANLSGDPEQDYFADGITEDIITGLSAYRTLRVISRTSSFRYRHSDLPIQQIAEELGVRFVLEGSTRRAGNRVRVTAQLIEAPDRHHVWADRHDAEMVDVFDVQDRIAESIVVAIDPAISISEASKVSKKRPESMSAWDHVQRGTAEMSKGKQEANRQARRHFLRAIELDPDYAGGHSGAAWTYFWETFLEWTRDPTVALAEGYRHAKRAIELDGLDASTFAVLGGINLWMGRLEAARDAAERAIEINPSLASGYVMAAAAVKYAGDPRAGVEMFTRAVELSPRDSAVHWFFGGRALGYFMLEEYEAAISDASNAIRKRYGYVLGRIVLIASLVEIGETDQAREQLTTLLSIHPSVRSDVLRNYPFSDATEAHRDRLLDGLRAAGLQS